MSVPFLDPTPEQLTLECQNFFGYHKLPFNDFKTVVSENIREAVVIGHASLSDPNVVIQLVGPFIPHMRSRANGRVLDQVASGSSESIMLAFLERLKSKNWAGWLDSDTSLPIVPTIVPYELKDSSDASFGYARSKPSVQDRLRSFLAQDQGSARTNSDKLRIVVGIVAVLLLVLFLTLPGMFVGTLSTLVFWVLFILTFGAALLLYFLVVPMTAVALAVAGVVAVVLFGGAIALRNGIMEVAQQTQAAAKNAVQDIAKDARIPTQSTTIPGSVVVRTPAERQADSLADVATDTKSVARSNATSSAALQSVDRRLAEQNRLLARQNDLLERIATKTPEVKVVTAPAPTPRTAKRPVVRQSPNRTAASPRRNVRSGSTQGGIPINPRRDVIILNMTAPGGPKVQVVTPVKP